MRTELTRTETGYDLVNLTTGLAVEIEWERDTWGWLVGESRSWWFYLHQAEAHAKRLLEAMQ